MLRTGLILRLFHKGFRIQRKRMFMTVAAIAWGTICIILLLSFGEGLKRQIEKNRRGLGVGIVMVWPGETSKEYKGFPPGRTFRFRQEDVELLRERIPEIETISGEARTYQVSISKGKKAVNKVVNGAEPCYEELRSQFPQPGGRYINELDMARKRRVAFIGWKLKEELFGAKQAIGEVILISRMPFTVIGVMQEKQQMGMYGGPDSEKVVIPLSTFEVLFGRDYLNNVIFKPVSLDTNEAVVKKVYEVLGGKHRFDPADERALQVWDTIKNGKVMHNMLLGVEIFLGVIGSFTLLVSGIGVANIIFAVVRERTKEIGVKMALGAKRSYIMGPFLLEALFITFAGGLIGILLSIGIIGGLASIKTQNEALEFIGRPTFSWVVALTTVALLGFIGFLAGYFPSRRAASVNPAESLRYE